MDDHTITLAEQQPNKTQELNGNNLFKTIQVTDSTDELFPIMKDEKTSDSDTHSEDLSSNDEQINVISSSNSVISQFYESSDGKIDYAVKIDDNDTLSDIDDIKTDSASADSEDSALGSLPPDSAHNDGEEEVQDRSEGSDSGLGSEATENVKLASFNLTLPCNLSDVNSSNKTDFYTDNCNNNSNDGNIESDQNTIIKIVTPLRSNLKRKCTEVTDNTYVKKRKQTINFDNVTVYYFPRAQGFSCVPSQGGSTLGMGWEHSHVQNFTLTEHALEQRRLHRQILQQLKNERHTLKGVSLSSSEDSDTEEEASDISESELDLDSYYFLQPVPTRQRRALLRAAGVRKIEGYEKDECRDIRTSREFCGCACKGACNPDNCSCSLAGIKCQVDRLNFPCGCTRDGCCNTSGRIEFNPVRVRTHFIQTLMRLGMEKKNEENQETIKRQWAEAHNSNANLSISNTSYDRERCLSHEDGLLRDVNLTPRVEVESCVNSGSFNNVHCNVNNTTVQKTMNEPVTYGYGNNQCNRNANESSIMQFENTHNHPNHINSYTSNTGQGKTPLYSSNIMNFNVMPNNMQRFPCELNYTYEQHSENHHFKGLQSYSATSFEEFAHNSQMSMFSHYNHMYVPEYLQKPNNSVHDHNSIQYHMSLNQHNYENVYKNNLECVSTDSKNGNHYTNLMTLPYQSSSNKLQSVENDENWFSHNTLINLDHSDQTTQDASDAQSHTTETPTESITVESTENFGELIKKTMVESVTV